MSALLATLFPESFIAPTGHPVEHRMDGSKTKDIAERTGLRVIHPKPVKVIEKPTSKEPIKVRKQRPSRMIVSERKIIKCLADYILTSVQVATRGNMNETTARDLLNKMLETKQVEMIGHTLSGHSTKTQLWRVKR